MNVHKRDFREAVKRSKRRKRNRKIAMRKRYCFMCKWRYPHQCVLQPVKVKKIKGKENKS